MSSHGSSTIESSKGGRDPFWSHGEKVEEKDTNRIRCRYCAQIVSGGISRLKNHLAGHRGNVKPCSKVPEDVKSQAVSSLSSSLARKQVKIARLEASREDITIGFEMDAGEGSSHQNLFSQMSTKGPMDKIFEQSSEDLSQKVKGGQTTIRDKWKKQAREDACEYIARWVYEAGIPFNVCSLPSFDHMLRAIGKVGPGLKSPNMYELREKYLKKEVERTKESLRTFTSRCRVNGCSILTDAWTDRRGRSIMNIVVHCDTGVAFWMSKNVSSEVHDGKFIFDFVDEAIGSEAGPGEENVVQVVTDNASNNMAAAKMLAMKRPHIFWTSCAAHTINLLLADIARIKQIRNSITLGRTLTVFIYGHTISLDLLRQFTKDLDSHDIIRPGVTRFATAFLSLQSIHEKKKELRAMFTSQQWDDCKLSRTPIAKKVYAIIFNAKFWEDVELVISVFAPLVKVLRRADGDEPSMGWLYGDMLIAKEEIALALEKKEVRYLPIWKLIDKRWQSKLSTPLHLAAYFLNPYFYYSNWEKVERDGRYIDSVIECMTRMYAKDTSIQDRISDQICLYRNQEETFGRDSAKRQRSSSSLNLVNWWKLHGNSAHELQDMAVRVLSLTTSSSGCERNWSTFEMLHTMKRNRLDQKRLNDLVFVKFNAKLKTKLSRTKRDAIASTNLEEGKVSEWMVHSNSKENLEDEDEEIFPGEGLTWQQVAECMDTNLEPRKSSRQTSTKKPEITKAKRKITEIEEVEEEIEEVEEEDEDDYETDNNEQD